MIQWKILKEDMMIHFVHVPNSSVNLCGSYGDIVEFSMVVEDVSTSLSEMCGSGSWKPVRK